MAKVIIVANIKDGHFDKNNPDHVYIGRWNRGYGVGKSKRHNPFKMNDESEREEVIEKYREYILTKPELMEALPELKGKTLFCYCKPKACHGDVLKDLVDQLEE